MPHDYFEGAPEQRAKLTRQLETIFRHPDPVLTGSLGRVAMYTAYGWTKAPAVRLGGGDQEPCDIDLLSTIRPLPSWILGHSGQRSRIRYDAHPVETELDAYITYGRPASLRAPNSRLGDKIIPVTDARVWKPVVRELLGVKVRTFAIGTQLRLETLMQGEKRSPAQRRAYQAFADFAKAQRSQKREFLPDDSYAPFDEYIRHTQATAR